ncbi:MAG: helix-turn-helix transcriptional regulator [Actinomycetota bacterium]|nr:helix-turn-helix transcriptional regulator [Actinomycetota bacterium]
MPSSPDFPPFAERQRRIRREKGLTLMQVSKVLGYRNAGYVSDTELGRFVPHPDKLAKWAEVLGMTQEEMDSRLADAKLEDMGYLL